ncbi:phage tail protein [Pectobacterium carotovorum]|uniref:phage tail protein n=1 Tax=Pectobacterium carotovorum TaxID=554 RepID=UPI001D1947F4|nr:phage tail protein [Pectobacterium carotovorum]
MALSLLAANNAQTVLAAGISAAATTMTVNTGTGVLFPSPAPGVSFFKITLVDAATGTLTEIVHVTQRTGDTMTIERAQEGTTARIWSANDIAANMMTAGTLMYVLDGVNDRVPSTRTVNGKSLSSDITLTASDVGALSISQNGADIANKSQFAKNAQVPHLGSSWIEFGGSAGAWTTSQFIDFLNSIGAFDHLYFVCAGTWSFSANKKISDTNCGHIELAGAVVEVFASRFNLRTVRVTTMSSSSDPLAIQGQFVYVESETPGSGEWRREFNTKNLTANDIGAVQISEIVGMPQPWPLTTIPTGWLPCAGQSFDTSAYPILASRYPSGILPDLRGEFIRGWDNGRGIDPSRANLSGQAFSTESHTHAGGSLEIGSGTPLYVGKGLQDGGGTLYSRTGVNNSAGTETRPRNIAFNYIVRAA